jgi:heme/copper-type cytochrome/quinol oxidase subunit 2
MQQLFSYMNLWGLADSMVFWIIVVLVLAALVVVFFVVRNRQNRGDE